MHTARSEKLKADIAETRPDFPKERDGAGFVLLVSAATALAYVFSGDGPVFDPWRHELLIDAVLSGRGFTLFDDAGYLWYAPLWYYPAAFLKSVWGLQITGALVALFAPVLLHRLILARTGDPNAATLVALAAALYSPLTLYTSGFGADGPALLLLIGALILVEKRPDRVGFLAAGLLFGLATVMRPNLLFAGALFIRPGRLKRLPEFALAAGLTLLGLYWRNKTLIEASPFIFSWDGLASPRESFAALSTLFPGLHPDVSGANERLNTHMDFLQLFPHGGGEHYGAVAFVFIGALAVLFSRRLEWGLGLLGFAALFAVSGFSKSVYPFRQWVGLFPVFFAALGDLIGRVEDDAQKRRLGFVLVLVLGFLGLEAVPPPVMPDKRSFLPPKGFLESIEGGRARQWLVFSNGYHPEVLIHEHPERRFLGLPWRPEQLEAFEAAYPDHPFVLWHGFEVQRELREHLQTLVAKGDYRVLAGAKNEFGVEFRALKRVRSPKSRPDSREPAKDVRP